MDTDRWNRVDRLLQSVLDLPAGDRDAHLRRACGGDDQLERDVRSLVAAHDRAGSFLGAPALEVAARGPAVERGDDGRPAGSDSLVGQTFSHYRIVERLGGGGMGVVYKAEDARLHRPVALKFVSDELARDGDALSRFQREARTASALNHPHICTIYDIGDADGRSFIAMEYLDGTTLRDKLAAGPLSLTAVLEVGVQIAAALDVAHTAGIIHRDIKPANIFLTTHGHAKLLDFGLAKMQALAVPGADVTTMAGTRQGVVMGTLAYMAPEQARGEAVDLRADLYSLGLVLYEMATGARPAPGVPLRIPASPELQRIIAKCLEIDPARRYQHAADLRADLERLEAGSAPIVAPPPRGRARAVRLGAAAAAVLALAVAGYVFYPRPTPVLTDKDTIVLAEFTNTTGDPVFDETLRQGLAVQLQQSPFLSLISEERIGTELALMKQPRDVRLTSRLAKDLCVRTASAAVIDGSIAALGRQYVLGLRATNCATGDAIADEQAQAARKEDVLGVLSAIADRLRTRVGESVATVEQYSKPLEEATTASLEAWKAFTVASRAYYSRGAAAAIPLFERAVAIDSDFAIAHARLGIHYSNVRESTRARTSTLRAHRLRERVSDIERFQIDTFYDRQVTGNLERQRQTLESWAQTYPRDSVPLGLLAGFATTSTGNYQLSIDAADKAITMEPDVAPRYHAKANSQLRLNRLAEAEATIRQAIERRLDYPEFVLTRYFIAFLNGDDEGVTRTATFAREQPSVADMMSHIEALALARSGRLHHARQTSAMAVDIAQKADRLERAALFAASVAVTEGLYGRQVAGRHRALSVLELARGRDVDYASAFALALAGDVARSQALANDLAKDFPEDTSVQYMYLPTLRALYALHARDPTAAIRSLETASRFDLALGALAFNGYFGALYPIYVRGLAFLAANKPAEAAAEFQRIIDHRSVVLVDPMDALARLQLARALDLAGEAAKAKSRYADLLSLWKNADPDIPVVTQARAEYARLP